MKHEYSHVLALTQFASRLHLLARPQLQLQSRPAAALLLVATSVQGVQGNCGGGGGSVGGGGVVGGDGGDAGGGGGEARSRETAVSESGGNSSGRGRPSLSKVDTLGWSEALVQGCE